MGSGLGTQYDHARSARKVKSSNGLGEDVDDAVMEVRRPSALNQKHGPVERTETVGIVPVGEHRGSLEVAIGRLRVRMRSRYEFFSRGSRVNENDPQACIRL